MKEDETKKKDDVVTPVQNLHAATSDVTKPKVNVSKSKEKKAEILGLVCDESMPKFNDDTLPIPGTKLLAKKVVDAVAGNSNKRTLDIRATRSGLNGNKRSAVANNSTTRNAALNPANRAELVFLEKYQSYLTYDWRDLQLGTVHGSAAWNKALKEKLYQNPSLVSVPQVTPLDGLQWVQRLQKQFETVAPDEQSDLRHVPRNTKWQNEAFFHKQDVSKAAMGKEIEREQAGSKGAGENKNDTQPADKNAPAYTEASDKSRIELLEPDSSVSQSHGKTMPSFGTIARLEDNFSKRVARTYQDCLIQDATDYRREYQCMRPLEIVERMRLLEQRAAGLQQRDVEFRKKSRESGFWDKVGC